METTVGYIYSLHQYLNCEILHGGTLLKAWPNAFRMRRTSAEILQYRPWNQVKTKKRSLPHFRNLFGQNLWICSDRLFLVWSTSAKISIGGRQILNGGTRPPYNLSTGLHPKDIELKEIFQESAMCISRALWIHSVPTNCRIKSNVEDSLEVKTLTSFQYCDAAHGMKQHDSSSQRP